MGGKCCGVKNQTKTYGMLPGPSSDIQASNENKPTNLPPKSQDSNIQQKFLDGLDVLVELVIKEIEGLCYSKNQVYQIAEEIVLSMNNIICGETQEEIYTVSEIFNPQRIKLIERDQIHYNDLLKICSFQKHRPCIQFRIFHTLANLVSKFETKKKQKPKYDQLNQEQLQELIGYECIEESIQKFSADFYMAKRQMLQTTHNMHKIVNQCISNHQLLIQKCKFDLSYGVQFAKFSRACCSYDSRGIFVLLQYLVACIEHLESKGEKFECIENKFTDLIDELSQNYPPGKGLEQKDKSYEQVLKDIEYPQINEPIKQFNYAFCVFQHQDKTMRKQELQKFIISQAQVAKQELVHLQNIIKETCLQKCIQLKIGLKLNSNTPNKKAIIRIIEKLLLKNQSQESQPNKNRTGNIREILQQQQQEYNQKIEDILEKKDKIKFQLGDMTRAKCTFSKLEDIIEAIENIKAYIAEQNTSHPSRYRILQIESRFTRKIPISDVTLNIVLNQNIVSQLQLTLQSNAADYNFAHKIYEFKRSQAFSKIKTIHNYFEEYQEQFCSLIEQSLEISQTNEIGQNMTVKKFFKLGPCKSLQDIIPYFEFQQKISSKNLHYPLENIKALIQTVFDRQMNKQQKNRIELIKESLRKKQSKTFNSIMYFQLLKDIDLDQKYNLKGGQSYSQYLFKKFRIKFQNSKCLKTARIYLKSEELEHFLQIYHKTEDDCNWEYQKFMNRIYGNSSQYSQWLMKKGIIYEKVQKYEDAQQCFNQALSMNSDSISIKLNQARLKIKLNCPKQGLQLLQNARKYYIEHKQHKKAVICLVLMSQCTLKYQELAKSIQLYNNAELLAKMHKVTMEGMEIANSDYRIGESLWKLKDNKNRIKALDIHLRRAYEEFGAYLHPIDLIQKMKTFWDQYKNYKIKLPILKPNKWVSQLNLQKMALGIQECEYLSVGKWENIHTVNLNDNNIGSQGCKDMIKGQWPNLLILQMRNNQIDDRGCQQLGKATWPKLKALQLDQNSIGGSGIGSIVQGYFPKIKEISLNDNKIGVQGCITLSTSKLPNIKQLYLSNNQIGSQGCLQLAKGKWPKLQKLHLNSNCLQSEGCKYLSKAKWRNLQQLSLKDNSIGNEGCQGLIQGEWNHLEVLELDNNCILDEGYRIISLGLWPKFNKLSLIKNKISKNGMQYLLQGKWPKLQALELNHTGIETQICLQLRQNKWVNLQSITLQDNNISDEICALLVMIQWPKLRSLSLNSNKVTDEGCKQLIKGDWTRLKTLQLNNNKITQQGILIVSKGHWPRIQTITVNGNKITNQKKDQLENILYRVFGSLEECIL